MSPSIKVRVVSTAYAVAAAAEPTVAATSPVVVTGEVVPSGGGTVQLQRLVGATWTPIRSAPVSRAAAFTVGAVLQPGSYTLRVFRPASTTVAAGASGTLQVKVARSALVVTTATLPAGTDAVPYSTQLTATGGLAPYSWTAVGLPPGLTLSGAGLLAGSPTVPVDLAVVATVTDAAGTSSTAVLPMHVAVNPHAGNVLYAWGYTGYGQAGTGTPMGHLLSPSVVALSGVIQAASSSSATAFLRYDGTVWVAGTNVSGELGDNGLRPSSATPVRLPGLTGVVQVAGGGATLYALTSLGTVWAWGVNSSGQIGDGTDILRPVPTKVSGISTAVQIAAGEADGYAVLADGTVRAWGANSVGQLGDGAVPDSLLPVPAVGLSHVTSLKTVDSAVIALDSSGAAWTWGLGTAGQLGHGAAVSFSATPAVVAGLPPLSDVAMSSDSAYALTTTGVVWSWGQGISDELGDGGNTGRTSPALTGVTGVTRLAAGGQGGYAVRSDGAVLAWGFNADSQLGNGTSSAAALPATVPGVAHATAVFTGYFAAFALVGS